MADRICSCCGASYTDDERHDYEQCVKACEFRVKRARWNLNDALSCLIESKTRRQAQQEGKIK